MEESKTSAELFEDYATSRVPDERTVGGFRIGLINGSVAFAVPGLVTGLEIGGALGLKIALVAFLLGGGILTLVGSLTSIVGSINRLTSCMIITYVFGRAGAAVVNLLFAFSLLGWFGVNMDLFSGAMVALSRQWLSIDFSVGQLEIGAGVLMTLTTIWGFRLLHKISGWIVPAMVLLFLYMLYQTGRVDADAATVAEGVSLRFGEAVSAVVGSFIVGAVLMPDFSRFAAKKSDAVVAAVIPFLLLASFVYVVAAAAGLAAGAFDALVVMAALGMGSLALVLVGVSSWVTNVINLYSAALGFNAVFTRLREWQIVIAAGVLGTLAASLDLLLNFTSFLFGLSVLFTPVAAIIVVDCLVLRRGVPYDVKPLDTLPALHWQAAVAWLLGVATSLLSNAGKFTITSIEACDAILVTGMVYWLLSRTKGTPRASSGEEASA